MKFKHIIMSSVLVMALTSAVAHAVEYNIGALYPMSGPNAEYGQIYTRATQLAVTHINKSDLLSGKLSAIIEDSKALPAPAVQGMNKLVNVSDVPYVLTGFTGVTKAIAPIGTRHQVVMVNGGGVGPDLAKISDYLWNIIPLVSNEMRALVPYVIKKKGLKDVALVYIDDPLGQSVLNVLQELVPQYGGDLVGVHSISADAQEFSGVASLVRFENPDVIFIASYGAQQTKLVKQLRDNGVTAQLASYSAFSIPSIQKLSEAKGAIYTSQAQVKDANKITKRFYNDYQEQFGITPGIYAVNYYNATRLFALLANELENEGKKVTGVNLLEKRREMDGFDLVGGHIEFRDNGTVKAPIAIHKLNGHGGSELVTVVKN